MKTKIRRQVLTRLKNKNIKANQYVSLYKKLFESRSWKNAKVVGITLNTKNEIPTFPVILEAKREGKTVVIPKVLKSRVMNFYQYNYDTILKRSSFGIWEPVSSNPFPKNKINLIIVPGIAFCLKNKQRIGYGGGFYDNYLVDYNGNTISLAMSEQIIDKMAWKPEKFDISVGKIIVGA